ncbi:MAG: hypothetical protein RMJ53_01855 [Chitinophagales bacterium]|nr:hypothetical protein [Chitinophagales bacterium]MDW8272953.1 hypothetical protein [Chitinophagales bacterium]
MKKISRPFGILFFSSIIFFLANRPNVFAQKQQNTGYLLVRVYNSNKFVASGNIYLNSKIFIAYEDGKIETIELLPFSEKNEPENLKKINATLNEIRKKGYLLMSATTTGEQGALVSDYIFLKQF